MKTCLFQINDKLYLHCVISYLFFKNSLYIFYLSKLFIIHNYYLLNFNYFQILKTIWEEVWNNFKISWLDVLEFRENHLCSPEQSIRMLNYRFHERRYQEQQNRSYQQSTDTYGTVPRYSVAVNNHPIQSHVIQHAPPLTGMHSFPPSGHSHIDHISHAHTDHLAHAHPDHSHHMNHAHNSHVDHAHLGHAHSDHHHMNHAHLGHSHLPQYVSLTSHVQPCPTQCIYGNPYYNYSTYAPVVPANHFPRYGNMSYPVCPPKSCNGYCYPNGCVPTPTYVCPVPTGQLIELEGQNGAYDTPDGITKAMRQHDYLESHKQLAKSTNLDSLTLSKSKEDGAGTFESWDYVYRNLESQGYNKDLGERGDLLQETRKKNLRDNKKTKPSIELEDAFNTLNLNVSSGNSNSDHNLKVNTKFNMEDVNRKDELTKVPQSSSYDNINQETNHKIPTNKTVSNGITKTKTLPRERLSLVSPEKPNHTLDTKKLRKQDIDKIKSKDTKEKKKDSGTWSCKACTYLNSSTVEICVICGKSKKAVDVTMALGGSECPRCTLVNPREVSNCQACDTSLLNSPTYI